MRAFGRVATGLLGSVPANTPRAACQVFAVGRRAGAESAPCDGLLPWLHALEAPVQLTLLTDRLNPAEVAPLGTAPPGGSSPDRDLEGLSARLARAGLVHRRLYLTVPATAAQTQTAGFLESGLWLDRLDADAVAALTRRLLVSEPMAAVLRGADVRAVEGRSDRQPSLRPAGGGTTRLDDGERSLARLALPDQLRLHPGYVDGDAGAAVLLYIDGLPRELEPEALAGALAAPDPVDLSLRLWPLAGDEVVRHLTRRLRDLRSTQTMAGGGDGDFRLATAVDDAEHLREALYLGQTRLLQASVALCARGADPSDALAVAGRVRARLARAGFLPRLAILRQWPALASMLPGAPDRLGAAHNVTSQVAARLLPLGLMSPDAAGMLLGTDEADHSAVHLDRTALTNPAGIYLGCPGSGKSSLAKMEILRRARTAPADRFLIVDPEGEYGGVVAALAGGLELDAAHPRDVRLPLLPALLPGASSAMRAARAATLLAALVGADGDLARSHLAQALDRMLARGAQDLEDLPQALARLDPRLAESSGRAVAGPLAALAGVAGPGPEVRALSLNLSEVDTALLPALLPVLTEAAIGHLHPAQGRAPGWLWLTLDEFHLYLERESGARLLVELAKRARKRGIVITAVTQHLVDLVRHPDGQAILAACETVALFRPGVDVEPFAQALRLDARATAQASTLAPGQALLRVGARRHLVRVALSAVEAAIADTRPAPAQDRPTTPRAGGGLHDDLG